MAAKGAEISNILISTRAASHFTVDDHVEVPLVVSCLVGGHALEASRVGDLGAGNNQPPTVGRHPQPLTLPDRLAVLVPPGGRKLTAVTAHGRPRVLLRRLDCLEALRDDRWWCSRGLTLQFQGGVDDHRAARHLVRSVNERRD